MRSVEVLNADYMVINSVSMERAKGKVIRGKAIIEEAVGMEFGIESTKCVLTKIRLVRFVDELYSRKAAWTPANLFFRDRYTCQYCGVQKPIKQLEVEHVFPKSLGGKLTWDNTVASCRECNQKKANRTPEEAGMSFYRKGFVPYHPNMIEFINRRTKQHYELK